MHLSLSRVYWLSPSRGSVSIRCPRSPLPRPRVPLFLPATPWWIGIWRTRREISHVSVSSSSPVSISSRWRWSSCGSSSSKTMRSPLVYLQKTARSVKLYMSVKLNAKLRNLERAVTAWFREKKLGIGVRRYLHKYIFIRNLWNFRYMI